MTANVVDGLRQQLLGAVFVRAIVFSVATLGRGVFLNDLAPHLLCAPAAVVGAFDDEAVELRSNEPSSTKAVCPDERLSVYGASSPRGAGRDAAAYTSVAKRMVTRCGDRVDKGVVAYRAEEIGIWLGNIGQRVQVEYALSAVALGYVERRLVRSEERT